MFGLVITNKHTMKIFAKNMFSALVSEKSKCLDMNIEITGPTPKAYSPEWSKPRNAGATRAVGSFQPTMISPF